MGGLYLDELVKLDYNAYNWESVGEGATSMAGPRECMGMIFQHFSLLERQTVAQNVEFPSENTAGTRHGGARSATSSSSSWGSRARRPPTPGALRRPEAARRHRRALALDPEYLLCDEATSALDPNTTRQVLALIRRVNERLGISTVIVTHAMSVVKEVCDEVSILGRSAMADVVGAGGIGAIALTFGYQNFNDQIMHGTVLIPVVLVQLIQYAGDRIYRRVK
ncbi:hypothetical protein [uncultured Parolsenella sp.]|uniref:hypothetical protein n=1 Tax=uncultured Parolsenella sp. TaxID=2083008 RepID=UPI0027D98F5E|nr:hypothetical protein [uncultured Parolsenella sp.]